MGGPDQVDASFRAEVEGLRAIEIGIAVADLDCQERLYRVIDEVTIDHEQRYLDENQDRLALLRAELPTMTAPPEDERWEWITSDERVGIIAP